MLARTTTRSEAPLVSIIVPCHASNTAQAASLAETLGTVQQQTVTDYELIVVDDGSPGSIADAVSAHPVAVVVRQENAGVAVARNTAIRQSSGEYLVLLDGDDHLLPDALDAGLHALAAHPECGFVVGPREEMTFEGAPVPWSVAPPLAQPDLYRSLLAFEWYIIPPSAVMFRRQVVDTIGGFQDLWGADLRASRHFAAWCYQSPAVTRYRRYSTSSSRDGERMLRSIRAVYERQWAVVCGDRDGEAAFHRGRTALTEIFRDCLIENVRDRLRSGDRAGALRSAGVLLAESAARWQALITSDDAHVRTFAAELDELTARAGGAKA